MASHLAASVMMPVRKGAKALLRRFGGPILTLYKRNALARRVMRRAEATIRQTPTMGEFQLYSRPVTFSAAKAKRVLGYRPSVPMATGVDLIGAWLRHHRYC